MGFTFQASVDYWGRFPGGEKHAFVFEEQTWFSFAVKVGLSGDLK
jgi:hypothetical protein